MYVFFTDKDCSERGTIREFFKNATLGLCYFHILNFFKEKLTIAEGFSKKQKIIELEKIRKIINSESEMEINDFIESLDKKF